MKRKRKHEESLISSTLISSTLDTDLQEAEGGKKSCSQGAGRGSCYRQEELGAGSPRLSQVLRLLAKNCQRRAEAGTEGHAVSRTVFFMLCIKT